MADRVQVKPREAERFDLRGEGLEVTYEQVPGNRALRQMTVVEGSEAPRPYVSGEIHLDDGNIGRIATVVTRFAHDGPTEKLSVVLPGVNLSDSPSAEVTTIAIWTVHRGHLGGPGFLDGALASYRAVALTGTANGGGS